MRVKLRPSSEPRQARVRLLVDADHYAELVQKELPSAEVALWIATANLKELRVEAPVGTRARARGTCASCTAGRRRAPSPPSSRAGASSPTKVCSASVRACT